MFNHWYTWVMLAIIVIIIAKRKKLNALFDKAEEAIGSGSVNTPLANLASQTASAENTKNKIGSIADKLIETTQKKYNVDLFDNVNLMAQDSLSPSDFINQVKTEQQYVMGSGQDASSADVGKAKRKRDQVWWPNVMYDAKPYWALSR